MAAGPLRRIGREIHCFHVIDSTNRWLLENAELARDGAIVTAEYQTCGRGRLGRVWLAPRGAAVQLSVLLHEPEGSVWLRLAAVLGAVAACEAIAASTVCPARVRWPNDLILDGLKLGGVLAESRPLERAVGLRALVLGIGINCYQQRGHFAPELAGKATSLELGSFAPVDRSALAAILLARLDAYLSDDDAERLVHRWRAFCLDRMQRAELLCDGQRVSGTILDIMPDGDLRLRCPDGTERVYPAATTTRLW